MEEYSDDFQWLKHFITEELFLIPEDGGTQNQHEPVKEPVPTFQIDDNIRLVLVLEKAQITASENHLKDFLFKVVQALELKWEEVLILDFAKDAESTGQITNFRFRNLVVFHHAFQIKGSSDDLYEIVRTPMGSILRADLLPEIEADQNKKKALWAALKIMFDIKIQR